MKIVLVRHSQAYESSEDSERRLTPKGIKEAQLIGEYLKKLNWKFSEILTSPLKRAVETANQINQYFNIKIKKKEELKPNQSIYSFEEILINYDINDSILFVLHMPDIAEIASRILKISTSSFYFSTGAAMGINLTNIQTWEGIMIFLYQPEYL